MNTNETYVKELYQTFMNVQKKNVVNGSLLIRIKDLPFIPILFNSEEWI
ncbi:MAG: hypothetical protein KC550_07735 [Nanoarchaeota archaeon]|nr:hypothetical protein [Nanoarchaeota archaeon]